MGKDIKYKVFVNNEVTEITSDEYDVSQKNVNQEYKVVNEIILNSFNSLKNIEFISDKKIDYVTFETSDNKKVLLYYVVLKNSGVQGNQAKRIALKTKHLKDGYQIYFLAIMNMGSNNLYVLTPAMNDRIKKYIESTSTKKVSSYSSYWISFENIQKCVIGNSIVEDENGNFITTDSNDIPNQLSQRIKQNNVEEMFEIADAFDHILFGEDEQENEVEDFNYELCIDKVNNNKLVRNTSLVEDVLRANQICKLCDKDSTFPSKKYIGLNYFEVHHFIPYNYKVQKNFIKTLDAKQNLVSLCPECHRGIHLSAFDHQEKLVRKLANVVANKDFIKIYPEYNIEKIVKTYQELYIQESGGENE